MTTRSYRQHCGLARALDVLGERWTLLVIRELSLGPKRFRDLMANLPGLGTNLLAARLKTLEAEGVLRKAVLPPPAGVSVYELTPRGEQLKPMLEGLALWGFELLPEEPADDAVRAAWAALSMHAGARPEQLADLHGTFAFTVDDERFHFAVRDGAAELHDGTPAADPDVHVTTRLPTFLALASHQLTPARAVREKAISLRGDRRLLEKLLSAFRLPKRAP